MEAGHNHLDCRNYAPVDVAKGICHAHKRLVMADDESCERFEKLPRCKHCANYAPGPQEYLGTCQASPARPMTYPDLSGVTCESFAWR
jgi:4-hydroxyphenylacetate decarboxylase small subunit